MKAEYIHLAERADNMKEAAERLKTIVELLRKKCPWDMKQTHSTLRKCMIEEAYEAAEAIDNNDSENLREELGDVLLQVVFHSIIAEEDKSFTMTDVINDECEKMMDGFGMTDSDQRGMYHIAMPKQFSMLYNSGCLILPFFKLREPLMKPTCLSSLNEFASIWCCVENILLAAAAENIYGVTRIPMTEELEHIKKTLKHPDNYTMPCYIALGYPRKDAKMPVQKVINIDDKLHINHW